MYSYHVHTNPPGEGRRHDRKVQTNLQREKLNMKDASKAKLEDKEQPLAQQTDKTANEIEISYNQGCHEA